MHRAPWSSSDSPPLTSAIDCVFDTASPPAARISATTSSAILPVPVPSVLPPRSFTTTLAPSRAISFAISAPIPRPAPVTTAIRPSSLPMLLSPVCSRFSSMRGYQTSVRGGSLSGYLPSSMRATVRRCTSSGPSASRRVRMPAYILASGNTCDTPAPPCI